MKRLFPLQTIDKRELIIGNPSNKKNSLWISRSNGREITFKINF